MEILTKEELSKRYEEIIKRINSGVVFIHPTDTIYGISCDATNKLVVEKVRLLKQRPMAPFSIWVPSKKWIKENCIVDEKWLKYLPGPYTLIVKLKEKVIAQNVTNTEYVGVRIPNHWFSAVVKDLNKPIITTSANKTGDPFMTSLETLDKDVESGIDFMIFEGEKKGKPSTIINTENEEFKEREK